MTNPGSLPPTLEQLLEKTLHATHEAPYEDSYTNDRRAAFFAILSCVDTATGGAEPLYVTHSFTERSTAGMIAVITESLLVMVQVPKLAEPSIHVYPLSGIQRISILNSAPKFSEIRGPWGGVGVELTLSDESVVHLPGEKSSTDNAKSFREAYAALLAALDHR
jgi:hypothetical protein